MKKPTPDQIYLISSERVIELKPWYFKVFFGTLVCLLAFATCFIGYQHYHHQSQYSELLSAYEALQKEFQQLQATQASEETVSDEMPSEEVQEEEPLPASSQKNTPTPIKRTQLVLDPIDFYIESGKLRIKFNLRNISHQTQKGHIAFIPVVGGVIQKDVQFETASASPFSIKRFRKYQRSYDLNKLNLVAVQVVIWDQDKNNIIDKHYFVDAATVRN